MPKSERAVSYAAPAAVVFNSAAQAVQNLSGWKLKEVNQQGWYITAAVSFSFWSYGENISIQVSEPSPGQPMLGISSSSVFAIFDFGKNKRNVNKFFTEVQDVLSQAGYPQAVTPAAAPQRAVAPAQGQVPGATYCTNCGVELRPGARFCTNCGQQMPQ
jgi:zinc-ribbon domain